MDIEKKNNLKEVIEWIITVVIAVMLALLVRHYIFTLTVVRQVSMKPTLEEGNRLILDRWSITRNKEIKKGEIITFEAPTDMDIDDIVYNKEMPVATYSNEPKGVLSKFAYYVLEVNKKSYIKRVIATEGDHILIENGKVYLNGKELSEDYLSGTVYTERRGAFYDITVPKGYVFAMGDNRSQSIDCRTFGCIPIDKVESKVFIRFWPFNGFGKVK